jgi:hypothetical protein
MMLQTSSRCLRMRRRRVLMMMMRMRMLGVTVLRKTKTNLP